MQVQAAIPYSKYLFLRAHAGSEDDDLPPSRALFVAGLPLCVATDDLLELFSVFGSVAALAVHPSQVLHRVINKTGLHAGG